MIRGSQQLSQSTEVLEAEDARSGNGFVSIHSVQGQAPGTAIDSLIEGRHRVSHLIVLLRLGAR